MRHQERADKFASEMTQRFEEFVRWTIENWPNPDFPLVDSDFAASRKEVQHILGIKLSQSQQSEAGPPASETVQYVNMNPAPWP